MLRKLLSLLSDAAVYGASSLLGQIINFLLLPVYMRYIDPTDNGAYVLIVNVMVFFAPLTNFGMINAVFRRFNLEKDPRERSTVLSCGLWTIIITTSVALTAGWVFSRSLAHLALGPETAIAEHEIVQFMRLALLTAAASVIGSVPLAVLRAERRVKTVATINLTRVLLTISTTMTLVVAAGWGVKGVFVGALAGEATCTAILFALTAHAFRVPPKFATWRRMASYGLPFVPHQIQGNAMEMLPAQAVGYALGLAEAGVYGIALRFAAPLTFIVNSIQNAWVPYKFQVHADDDDPKAVFRTIITYYVAAILYLWVGVSLWAPELVWAMGVPDYYQAAMLVPFVGLIPVSRGIYFMLGTGMELSDDTRPLPLVTLAGLITAAVSAWVLLPLFGVAGGALAGANSYMALTVVLYYFSQQRFPIRYDWPALLALIALAIVAVAIGCVGLMQPAVVRLPLSILISLAFPLAEFAILVRSTTERDRMWRLWSKIVRRKHSPELANATNADTTVIQAG